MSGLKLLVKLILLAILLIILWAISLGGLQLYKYTLYARNPASFYQERDIVNDKYIVVASDDEDTLWLQTPGEDCTYIAKVTCEGWKSLSLAEKLKTTPKNCAQIEIAERIDNTADHGEHIPSVAGGNGNE